MTLFEAIVVSTLVVQSFMIAYLWGVNGRFIRIFESSAKWMEEQGKINRLLDQDIERLNKR